MSEKTKIQWCDDTHNFWRGCVKVSPGCANCYAEVSTPVRVARSEGRELWGGKLRDRAKDFDAPLRWNKKPWVCDSCGTAKRLSYLLVPGDSSDAILDYCDECGDSFATFHRRRVFSLSLGDWLDPDVPIEWLADMLDIIRRTPNLDYLLLTKRPELWRERLHSVALSTPSNPLRNAVLYGSREFARKWIEEGAFPENVWLGTTVEDQTRADERIPHLLRIPAACRFLSVEPMLGPVDLGKVKFGDKCGFDHEITTDVLNGSCECPCCEEGPEGAAARIDWTIIGGESGPKARPFNIDWARSIVRQCREAGVACFVKQIGRNPEWSERDMAEGWYQRFSGPKGGDISEWPNDLRVREWPTLNTERKAVA